MSALALAPIVDDDLFIDGFAGGGGASTGIAQARGRDPDIAVNHSESALAIHRANHPNTEHHCADIRLPFLPMRAARGRRVSGMWMSPDCKEFSKAKGGPLKDRSIRTLADEIPHWIEQTQPEVVYVENVEEFEDWGPLEQDENGKWRVIFDRKGEDFQKWVRRCRRLGYRVEWRQLRACDYGAPTSRNRLYIIMRRNRGRIFWPKPTHGHPDSAAVKAGRLFPYRTAAECIDWSIRCPSIFDRKKAHAEATNKRIAHGVVRHVLEAAKLGKAFIVERDGVLVPHIAKFRKGSSGSPIDQEMPTVTANGVPARPAGAIPLGLVEAKLAPFITYGQHGGASRPANDPHHTVAASNKDTNQVAAATLVKFANGNAPTAPGTSLQAVETHSKHAAVTAFMSRFYGSDKTGGGGDPEQPLATTRAGGQHHSIVCASMAQFNTNPNGTVNEGRDMRAPVSTIATRGPHQGVIETTLIAEGDLPPAMLKRATLVAAFLIKYYGEGGQSQAANVPLDVVTTKARFAVVTVTIDAVTYVIVDIGLRMLKPRELARAQGFPDDYILDPECWYTTPPSKKYPQGQRKFGRLPIAMQISAIGNSVCPPMARALVLANQPRATESRRLAA